MRLTFLTFAQTVGLTVFGVLLAGCPPTPSTTATETQGSSGGECEPGTLDCICYSDSTCAPGFICASNVCIDDPSVTPSGPSTSLSTTGPGTGTETATSTSGTDASSTTTAMLECDPQQGVVNSDCQSEDTPYCAADGTCVACDEIACEDVGAEVSVCDEKSGLCVECSSDDASACSNMTPICDDASKSCVPCSEHDECESGACHLYSGACFPNTAVWVDKSKPCSGNGTEAQPYCEIGDAVDDIGSQKPTIVWVVPNKGTYVEKVSIEASRIIAIRSTSDEKVRLAVSDKDALLANLKSFTFLDKIDIRDSDTNRGIVCSGGSVWADESRVSKRSLGVDAMSGCELTFRRSEIVANQAGGIQISGGSLRVENTFVVDNGGQFSEVGGIAVSSADLNITYTTIVNNNADVKGESSLGCTGTDGEVRNSIIAGLQPDTVECSGVIFNYSSLDDVKLPGSNNTINETVQASWFVNAAANNFHLAPGDVFEIGLWVNGQPKTDVDGDPRPTVDGTVDYVGADVP